MSLARKPPRRETGALAWLRRNLFGSVWNALATLLVGVLLVWVLLGLFGSVLFEASWGQVWNNLKLFAVYRYPSTLLWRPLAVVALIMALLGLSASAVRGPNREILRGVFWQLAALIFFLSVVAFAADWRVRWMWLVSSVSALAGFFLGRLAPGSRRALPWLWLAALPVSVVLLYGVPFASPSGPMRVVPTREWGGFMLTLVLFSGIVVSFPLGVALALGRRSQLPAIKYFCIAVIELIRGAPLITWLFIAALLVPLLLNVDTRAISGLAKAYTAITLFSAVYMAENVRGGLQAIPRGQYEAARALGLSGWSTMRLIILPQALKAVIPAMVGQAIGLFKDTSLVFIVALFDLFNVHNIVAQQTASLQVVGGVRLELSLFLAVFYFFFAYRMSVASRQLEKQLGVGER